MEHYFRLSELLDAMGEMLPSHSLGLQRRAKERAENLLDAYHGMEQTVKILAQENTLLKERLEKALEQPQKPQSLPDTLVWVGEVFVCEVRWQGETVPGQNWIKNNKIPAIKALRGWLPGLHLSTAKDLADTLADKGKATLAWAGKINDLPAFLVPGAQLNQVPILR
jgi:hypothetical protein